MTLCVSGIVRAVHQSSSKLRDTPLVRLDLFESLPSRRFGCRASTTNSTTKSRSTSLYNARSSSRARCRALELYSAPERSTSLHLYSALHSTSSTPSLRARLARSSIKPTKGKAPENGALYYIVRDLGSNQQPGWGRVPPFFEPASLLIETSKLLFTDRL